MSALQHWDTIACRFYLELRYPIWIWRFMIYVPTIFTDFLGRILSGDELDVNFDFGTLDLYNRSSSVSMSTWKVPWSFA